MSKYRSKKLQLLKIKSAISEFIRNTENLVKCVEPDAKIVIPKNLPQKRKRKSKTSLLGFKEKNNIIAVPNFKSKGYSARNQKK
jgi:hypothetical protein